MVSKLSLFAGMCSVFLPEEDRTVNVSPEHLVPVKPDRQNKVKVILGEDRESTGTVKSAYKGHIYLYSTIRLQRTNVSVQKNLLIKKQY